MDHTATEAVKIVLEWRVREDAEDRFAPWIAQLARLASDAGGYEGSSVLSAGDDWFLLLRFGTRDDLRRWQEAPATVAHLASAAPFAARAEHAQERSGLETWFALPGQRSATPPPKWKMALVTWLCLLPQVVVLALLLPPLPFPLGAAVSTAIPVALLTWAVMPRVTRWLADWLYPRTAAS